MEKIKGLKPNMYVRTPMGIAEYLGIYNNDKELHEFDQLDEDLWSGDLWGVVFDCDMEDVVLKSSDNIIDLIEENDFINDMRVSEIKEKTNEYISFMADSDYEFVTTLYEKDIYSILTKEQLEKYSFKIGGKNNE